MGARYEPQGFGTYPSVDPADLVARLSAARSELDRLRAAVATLCTHAEARDGRVSARVLRRTLAGSE